MVDEPTVKAFKETDKQVELGTALVNQVHFSGLPVFVFDAGQVSLLRGDLTGAATYLAFGSVSAVRFSVGQIEGGMVAG